MTYLWGGFGTASDSYIATPRVQIPSAPHLLQGHSTFYKGNLSIDIRTYHD